MENIQEILGPLDQLCQDQIAPFAQVDDKDAFFRKEIFQQFGENGHLGLLVPEEFEGSFLGYSTFCEVLRVIGKYSVAHAVTVSVSSMVQGIIVQYGSLDQKKKFLPSLAKGEKIGAFALTESHAGSDPAHMKTKYKSSDKGFTLSGNKIFITSSTVAEVFVVMAQGKEGISAFLVEKGTPGLSFGKIEDKMGWRASPTGEVILENVKIPKENLLGSLGKGLHVAFSALNRGRITIGAISVGLGQKALESALEYALYRKQFGKSIFSQQGISFLISDLYTEVESASLLVKEAARLMDSGTVNNLAPSVAKLSASDMAMNVTTQAVQILGGVGYTKEYPFERYMRDAKALQIVEGTNQIQKLVIARELEKKFEELKTLWP